MNRGSRRSRLPFALALALGAAATVGALAVACAPAKKPEPKPVVAAPPDPAPAEARRAEPPLMPPTLVVIDRGASEEPPSLAEASRAERERRRRQGKRPQAAVINDKNLAEFGAQGQVTEAKPEPAKGAETDPTAKAPGADAGAAPGDLAAGGDATADEGLGATGAAPDAVGAAEAGDAPAGPRDEAYWSDGAREIRRRWRQSADEVVALEKESAALRWKFYAEDDPYLRDQQIKPEWDRVLDDLRRGRQDERAFQHELADFLEAGRRAGALPGWLREGIELEPAPPETKPAGEATPEQQSIEPPIVDEPRP